MNRRDAGYTLIELIVALLLLSFISLLVSGGVQFGTRAWEHSDNAITSVDATENGQAILREMLAHAVPNRSDGLSSFEGVPNRAVFDGPAPAAFGSGGLVHFTLSLEKTDGGGTRITLAMHSLLNKKNTRETTLAEVPGLLRLSYLDASSRVPAWLAVWRNRGRLPDAVRLEDPEAAADPHWPSFVARLPIAQDATCIFDPVSVSCRRN